MYQKDYLKLTLLITVAVSFLSSFSIVKDKNLLRAEYTLEKINTHFDAGNNLLKETFPDKPDKQAASYLWPASAYFSGAKELYKASGEKKYLKLIMNQVIPLLDQYYDKSRLPHGYQSGIVAAGQSDRYYDDDIWLGIDFCELFSLTGNKEFLTRALDTWKFVFSGYDDILGGGIYWCEQKKTTKNTCSNAPASVLALKLFAATGDSTFFQLGKNIYDWTQANLRDPGDHLYNDNIDLSGKVDSRKYTYNSGQMLQASVMLYKMTGEKIYLDEAGTIAKNVISHFTEEYKYNERTIRLFKNTGNWFNYILLRGYMELYSVDKNPVYLQIFIDNMDQVWDNARTKEGLFVKDWKGKKENQYNELLDQAGMMSMFACLASTGRFDHAYQVFKQRMSHVQRIH